jgi:hypothetical protein
MPPKTTSPKQLTSADWQIRVSKTLNGVADIEALALVVLMEAANSAQEDLQAIMAGVQAINAAKQRQREVLCEIQRQAADAASKERLDAAVDAIKESLDSMSELGETESLRLQMAMDRLSKLMSTLSNILKKISDTSQSITQNLK